MPDGLKLTGTVVYRAAVVLIAVGGYVFALGGDWTAFSNADAEMIRRIEVLEADMKPLRTQVTKIEADVSWIRGDLERRQSRE